MLYHRGRSVRQTLSFFLDFEPFHLDIFEFRPGGAHAGGFLREGGGVPCIEARIGEVLRDAQDRIRAFAQDGDTVFKTAYDNTVLVMPSPASVGSSAASTTPTRPSASRQATTRARCASVPPSMAPHDWCATLTTL